ncbi:aminotransferase class I/II-fold pyridoxal phosphate-dependent enzyme [Methylobacter sp. Wu1]|uniref:aminotransferase class I/II-fold pyridoxal phosphate-dependent enzyme n=1 Tax=Methylobacter sp. Wu1 TaxID=3119359 RepID=UPI002F93F6C7
MKHGGNIYRFAQDLGCLPEQVLDFSANINPQQAVTLDCLLQVQLGPYADPHYSQLKQALKQRYPCPSGADIEVFNGASAAIFALLRFLKPDDLVLYAPLYGEYAHIAGELGCRLHSVDRFANPNAEIPRGSTIIFVNPSTPDGCLYDLKDWLAKWQAADCTVIIDESFLDFCDTESIAGYIADYDKLYLIKSLSKFYGCAGIRIGFVMAASPAINALKGLEPAWKLSSLDMAYMQQALANTVFIGQTRRQTRQLREQLHQALSDCGLFRRIYEGQANFLLAELAGMDGYQLQEKLAPSRILIRVCDSFAGLTRYHVRFAVKDERAIAELARCLNTITSEL